MDETKKNSVDTPVVTDPNHSTQSTAGSVSLEAEAVTVGTQVPTEVTTEQVASVVAVSETQIKEAGAIATENSTDFPVEPERVVLEVDTTDPVIRNKPVWQGYVIAATVITLMMAGVWYVLERDGRVTTSIFTGNVLSGLFAGDPTTAPVVRVNDVVLTAGRLQPSIDQITQAAVQQGADPSDPTVAAEIRTQALAMLVNTELLLQAAATEGIAASDEEVDERIVQIEEQFGGPEALAAELETASVTMEQLRGDVVTEITIQTLLTKVVGSEEVAVTEAEITELYNSAGGEAAGIPPLAEVREQVIAQVRQTKEQALVQTYLESLRQNADIEELQ